MRKRQVDEKMAEWFRTEAEGIPVPPNMKTEIDERIRTVERRKIMRFSAKKVALVAAAVALIGSVTAVAAGRLAASESHSNLNDAVKNYEEVAALEGEVGFAFPALEEFSNGFKFTSAVPAENSDYDEEGNVLGSYQSVDLTYTDGTQDVNIFIQEAHSYDSQEQEAVGVVPVWQGEKEGIALEVTRTVHKFVPADYELTEEDIQAQENGSLVFAYGSNEVEETVSYSCNFTKDGLSYGVMGFDLTMQPEELAQMAAELVTQGE